MSYFTGLLKHFSLSCASSAQVAALFKMSHCIHENSFLLLLLLGVNFK